MRVVKRHFGPYAVDFHLMASVKDDAISWRNLRVHRHNVYPAAPMYAFFSTAGMSSSRDVVSARQTQSIVLQNIL
jgi:hypothetical protein